MPAKVQAHLRVLIFQSIEVEHAIYPGRGKPVCTTHAARRKPRGPIRADHIQRP